MIKHNRIQLHHIDGLLHIYGDKVFDFHRFRDHLFGSNLKEKLMNALITYD